MDEEQRRLAEELLFAGEKKPSFAKMLYFGIFDSKRVFPFPYPSTEDSKQADTLVAQLEEFAKNNIDGDKIDREAEIPQSVIEGLGKLGLLGFTIPKEYGGQGMSQYTYSRMMETLARHCGSTALFVNAHHSIGVKALLLFGTEEQRRKWLPTLAKGEELAAFSLTEPNAGSDASGVETKAIFDPEKGVYRITGKKQWTTNGSIAKALTVMAKTAVDTPEGPKEKITAFLVRPDMPGFNISNPGLEKVGMRGTRTTNLLFDNMEVPKENVLGPLGAGLKVCLTVLDYGRTTFGATCTGCAKLLLEKAVHHAKTRYQFKRPLASFPLVKEKLAMMAAHVYAMESATYMTAGLVDSGESEFMLEAALLKVFNSDALWQILYDTMQIYGGKSFFTDAPFERMMRDARLNMIGEGSNEVMRAFIGVVGMRDVGLQLKTILETIKHPIDNASLLTFAFSHCLDRIQMPKIPIKSREMKEEARRLAQAVRKFGFSVAYLLAKYKEEVIEKQLCLDRIATSAMALYTMTAVISRIDADLSAKKATENDLAIAKLYCHLATTKLNNALKTLYNNNLDDEIEAVSDLITK